jgi:hypothetical protein
MARLVEEIMNRELFAARPLDPAGELVNYYSSLGISVCPVLESDGLLVGMISLRDLVGAPEDAPAESLMKKPVTATRMGSSIEEAARLLAETGYHHLPVVDADNRVVGIVSSLDVIRGLTGIPARHPQTFPHLDRDTGLLWTDDVPLAIERVEAAADGPGIIAIVHGGAGVRERVVWAEMTNNMRTRLIDLLSLPQDQHPALRHWLEKDSLRFRSCNLEDRETGRQVADKLQRQSGGHAGSPR